MISPLVFAVAGVLASPDHVVPGASHSPPPPREVSSSISQAVQPTPENANAFLRQVMSNGVTRVHLMRSTDEIVQPPRAIKTTSSSSLCFIKIIYTGEWFGLPEDFELTINFASAGAVKPFYEDQSRSVVAFLATVYHIRRVGEQLPGLALDLGSESMEPRVLAAAQMLATHCNPQQSFGF